jgi:tetratricopeptide (TPR) repeat protein
VKSKGRGHSHSRHFTTRNSPTESPVVQKFLADALREHAAGNLDSAKSLYLRILEIDAKHGRSLFGLGIVAYQVGSFEVAEKMIRRAIAIHSKEPVFHSSLGLVLQVQRRLDDALSEFQYVLTLKPNDAEAHFNLGTVLLELKRQDEARPAFEHAIACRPGYAEAYNNLGNIFWNARSMEEARQCYERALSLQPDFAQAHANLGNVLREIGDIDAAKTHYERSLAVKPDSPEVLTNLGNVFWSQRKLEESKTYFHQAIALNPNYAEAYDSLGVLFQEQGKYAEAKAYHERAIALNPSSADAFNNLGVALCELHAHSDAIACHERALALRPQWAEAHNNLGVAFKAQGRLEEAGRCYQRALAARPHHPGALNNLGYVFQAQNKLEDAMHYYQQALGQDQNYFEALWNRALVELLQGDYEAGWKDYEVRHKSLKIAPRSFSKPLWRGEPLDGARILLHSEQGLGDTIQFLRYVPVVIAAGGAVILDVPRTLCRLAESIPGVAALTVSGEALPPFDCHCPLMSLPLAIGTDLDSIPNTVPYLNVAPDACEGSDAIQWADGNFQVGLVWSGNPKHREDQLRSLTIAQLAPLFEIPKVQFFSLQVGPASSQLADGNYPIVDLQSAIKDMADTAVLISHLDLVLAVDTAVAHLAAALGKQTWVLVPFAPDWRWLMNRRDSPWYPTMRLFRQQRLSDWPSVIEQVRNELAEMLDQRTPDSFRS